MTIKTAVFIIFIIALLPRLTLALFSNEQPTYDAEGYDLRAMSILEDGVFGQNQKPTSFKPPVYSFFLAVIYGIFGHSYLAVRIIQSILGALTCIIIYFIALKLTHRNVALLSGLLAAMNISFIKSSEHLLSEILSTFLISLIVLSLLRLNEAPTLGKRLWTGFLAGLIALTRSEMIFFMPFVYGGWFFLVWLKRYSRHIFLKDLVVTLVVFLIVVSLWTIRNWRLHRAFVPLTTAAGINLYSSYCPPEGKLFGFTSDDNIVKLSRKLNNEVEQSRFLLKETLNFIRHNLHKIPRLELLKFMFFWSVFDWEIIGSGIYNFFFGFMLPFFLWAFLVNIKKWQQYFLLYISILYFQIITLLFYGSPRFRIQCEPFIIIFAATGIMHFFQKSSKRIITSVIFIMFLLADMAGYFYSPILKDSVKWIFVKIGLW
jgi:4-amino-4-deoxy-L-arabinose transferase-like glycosyltransferase